MNAWQREHPCGPHSWKRAPWWLPCVPQFVFRPACRMHDHRYSDGGTASDRLRADREFRATMFAAIRKRRLWRRPLLWLFAGLYYWIVRRRGASRFNYHDVKPVV